MDFSLLISFFNLLSFAKPCSRLALGYSMPLEYSMGDSGEGSQPNCTPPQAYGMSLNLPPWT